MAEGQIRKDKQIKENSELCQALIKENNGCVVYGSNCHYATIEKQKTCVEYRPSKIINGEQN
jgi:hypothetical protein